MDKILHSNAHIIATMGTKQDYVLNQKDGKFVPEKVGLKSVQRDGLDYEFTLVFDIDIKHFATSSKDRTGLFMGKPDFIISEKTGKEILDWCNAGSLELPTISPNEAFNKNSVENTFEPSSDLENTTEEEVYESIQKCQNIQELYGLYKAFPQFQSSLKADFEVRKSLIINGNYPPYNKIYKYRVIQKSEKMEIKQNV